MSLRPDQFRIELLNMEKLRGTELKCLYRQRDVPPWIHGPLLDGEKKLGPFRELDLGSQADCCRCPPLAS